MALFDVAIKTQRTKQALRWLTQAQEKYFASWSYWAHQGRPTPSALVQYGRIMLATALSCSRVSSTAAWIHDSDKILQPIMEQKNFFGTAYMRNMHYSTLPEGAGSWWESDEWALWYHHNFPKDLVPTGLQVLSLRLFWGTFG